MIFVCLFQPSVGLQYSCVLQKASGREKSVLEIFYKLKLLINFGLNYVVVGIKGKRLCIISKHI